MINAQINYSVIRIIPPNDGHKASFQYGTIREITDEKIIVEVQVDIPRFMEFSRKDGMDTNGIGSFIIVLGDSK